MIKQYFLKNWVRKLIFVSLLLSAYPIVNFILGSENLTDLGFWGTMFVPEFFVVMAYLIISFLFWVFLRKKLKTYLILDVSIFFISFITLFSPVPNLHSELSRHNDEIDAGIRNDMHTLSEKIIESIKNDDPTIMYNLFVEELKEEGIDNVKNLYSQLAPAIKGKTFELYNEYYVISQNWRAVQFSISSETDANNKFYMFLNTASNNAYISLLSTEGEFKDLIFCFVYVKVKGQWRLHIAHLGVLRMGGKTVPVWLQEAGELSAKRYDIPALFKLNIANQFLRPAQFIQYAKEKEVIDLSKEIQARINSKYKFPIRLSSLPNTPEIYHIGPQFLQMNLLPTITYVTKIPLDNASELQKEVDAMTPELKSIFPGITKNVSHITYKAFSQPPTDPQKTYDYYGLTAEIN